VNARSILASLVALAATVSADSGGGPPSPPYPALSVAPLVYAFVPDPLGARTWAERQMEAVRLGIGAGARERGSDGAVLVDPARTRADYALEMSEAPPDVPRRAEPVPAPEEARPEEQRMMGALEAMGLRPEDLVEAPEAPAAVLALADILARVDALLFPVRPRARGADVASLRVDPENRHVKQPSYLHYKKPPEDPEPKRPPLTLYAKRITRSLYKMLLGVAIGILIWGFVRNSA
jgi:hypothetical protein